MKGASSRALGRLALCVLAALALLGLAAAAWADGPTPTARLFLWPPSWTMVPGEVQTIDVEVREVSDLYGFQVYVHYDPTALEVAEVRLGGFLTPGFPIQTVDEDAGRIMAALAQVNPEPPKSGGGTLFSIDFIALQAGASDVSLDAENSILTDRDAQAFDVTYGPYRTFLPLVIR